MRYKKSGLFYRNFLSYILVFIIPFVCMSTYGYVNFLSNINNENRIQFDDELKTIISHMDDMYYDIQKIVERMYSDVALSRFMIVNSPLGSMQAIKELSKYKSANGNISDIWLYYDTIPDYIYTTSGTWSVDLLYKNSGLAGKTSIEEYSKNNTLPALISENDVHIHDATPKDFLIYIFPIDKSENFNSSWIAFFVPMSTYSEGIEKLVSRYNGFAFIYDTKGSVLAYLDCGSGISQNEANRLAEINNKEYIQFEDLDSKAIHIKAMLDNGKFTLQARQSLIYMVLFGLAITLVCIVVAFIFALLNYSPLQKIVKSLNQKSVNSTSTESIKKINELDIICTTIEKMQTDYHLVDTVLLKNLIYGNVSKSEAEYIEERLRLMDMHKCVVVFKNVQSYTSKGILNFTYQDMKVCIIYLEEYEHMAILIGMKPGTKKSAIESLIDFAIKNKFADYYDQIGVGRTYNDTIDAAKSYIEALSVMSRKDSSQHRSRSYFESVEINTEQWYPTLEESKLVQSLKMGNEVAACETVESILCHSDAMIPDISKKKCIENGMVNAILHQMIEVGLNVDTFIQKVCELPLFSPEKPNCIKECCTEICRRARDNIALKKNQENNSIVEYIRQHYNDNMLSIGQLTVVFNRSETYISQAIKDCEGVTFGTLVWNLRYDEIRSRLIETDEPIKNIVTDAGYIDVSNFTRKFKSYTGMSMSEYRNLYKKNKALNFEI